jgi:undecaprenyl-diphosphatase
MSSNSPKRNDRRNPLRRILEWIGGHELSVYLALLTIGLGVWGFIAIADEVVEGDTARFDEWAVRALRQADNPKVLIGPRWMNEVARDMTALGGVAFLSLLTATVVGFLWLRKMYGAVTLVIAATLGGLIVSTLLKWSFDRPRPNLVPQLSSVYTSSFPSGHSMLSAAVFLTLGTLLGRFVQERKLKAYFLIVALTLTTLVGVSRVYLGVHYPTDVLAGWSAGMAWAVICWLVTRLLQQRGAVEHEIAAVPSDGT